MPSLDQIVQLLVHFRYLILYPIAVLEGPIISIIGGFLVSRGYLNFIVTYLVLAAGDLTGDFIYYTIGRWGGQHFIKRWGARFGLNAERMAKVDQHFFDHGGKTLLFGKWTQTVGAPILVTAGVIRMPLKKYFLYNTLGQIPKSLVLIVIGYYFGKAYNKWDRYLNEISLVVLIIIILIVVIYFFKTRKNR